MIQHSGMNGEDVEFRRASNLSLYRKEFGQIWSCIESRRSLDVLRQKVTKFKIMDMLSCSGGTLRFRQLPTLGANAGGMSLSRFRRIKNHIQILTFLCAGYFGLRGMLAADLQDTPATLPPSCS